MEIIYKLEKWFQLERISGRGIQLTGEVYNHPEFISGTLVTTTPLSVYYASTVASVSGSRYYLGRPDPEVIPEGEDPFACRDRFLAHSGLKCSNTLQEFNMEVERIRRSMTPGGKVTQRPAARISLGGTFAGRLLQGY